MGDSMDDKRIVSGADEQFLARTEAGWAVVSVGTLARWAEDSAHDGEVRYTALWHLPQGDDTVPVPAVTARRVDSTQRDGQGCAVGSHRTLEVVPEVSGEPVASATFSVNLDS